MSKMVHQAGFSYFDDGYEVAPQTQLSELIMYSKYW